MRSNSCSLSKKVEIYLLNIKILCKNKLIIEQNSKIRKQKWAIDNHLIIFAFLNLQDGN